jgi:hypothetical protein
VARYREETKWLRRVPTAFQQSVYNKDDAVSATTEIVRLPPDSPARIVSLPNIGREAHTYLHHLVAHYDELPDYTVFCQGKPFDHAYDFHHTLRALAADPELVVGTTGFRWLGHIIDTDDTAGQTLFRSWSKNEDGRGLDLRGFHRALFGSDGPDRYTFVLGAQFVVSRAVVQRQPLAFYERALAVSIDFPDAAHCYERSWDRVFGLIGIDPNWLAGRKTVYLKPVKRLTDS